MFASVYMSFLIMERQNTLNELSGYNMSWALSQGVSEFMRIESTLSALALPESGVSRDDARLRLDIMFGRLDTLENGATRDFIRKNAQRRAIFGELKNSLDRVEDFLSQGDASPQSLGKILATLAPLGSKLTALASVADQVAASNAAKYKDELQGLHLTFSGMAGGLIVCGLVLVALLLHHNRLLGRTHQRLRGLAADLQGTSNALQAQNDRFGAALDNMSQALCTFDKDERLVVCNHRFADLAGMSEDLRPGMPLAQLLARSGKAQQPSAFQEIYSHQATYVHERRKAAFVEAAGPEKWIAVAHEPLADGGWLATYEDVSERRRSEAQIAHMAHHDALTGLANRVLFQEELGRRFEAVGVHAANLVVCCVDLDGFKDVNDTLGHQVGDELLTMVAERLKAHIGSTEHVARLGGDEFAVLCTGPSDQVRSFARQLVAELSRPYFMGEQEITIGASIGIADYPGLASSPDELLKYADLALYQAKGEGKGRFRFFEEEMDERLQSRKALETDLRKALQHGEMEVHFQPLLDTASREICGYEALLRWTHRDRGPVSPAEFIPIAEDIGLIGTLGEWVLRQACAEAMNWPAHLSVSINLSPVQFRNPALINTIVGALAASGLPAERLELEITESVLLDPDERTTATLHQIKALGVAIAMDDFGTGYSSLASLRSFPFDKIKIDKSFVQELAVRPEALAVVRLIVGLGRDLGMATTAEGVETEEQLACLRTLGCTQVQGFLFARPMPARDLLRRRAPQLTERAIESADAGLEGPEEQALLLRRLVGAA
ncbi:putative bifunctional diguanylate cyclase/phosphodiesterase [Jiella marina]|uniref:putative bifunctional diguanylate cyclase/phosphodiesterase n=1 Tax=Jiella sp. LLJ827 TaxID=2917712 RepID=UPI002100CB9F|nr:EAL domain-containing protein [Jiella sp. LLJ827]MCQ0988992.1 EAL domain-containing protein [Jiella sp. LLJ827]